MWNSLDTSPLSHIFYYFELTYNKQGYSIRINIIQRGVLTMNKNLKHFFRKVTATSLAFTIILSSIHVFANEIPVPDISEWAVPVLNEGERYGTYPMDWYYDSFRAKITNDRANTLLTNTANKFDQLGLNKKDDFKIADEGNITRGDFLSYLFNVIVEYKITSEDNPITYFQERGIILGTNNGLDLDKPCTTEQAVIFSTRLIENVYNQYDGGGKGFVWKVENDGNTIYLLGSIHIGNSMVYPLNQRLKKAFNESDALIVEANLFDQSGGIEYFVQKATYQDGTVLKDNVNEHTYNKLLKVLEKFGIPENTYSIYKVWSVANDMNVFSISKSQSMDNAAQSANLGIDIYFLSNALMNQKPIIELEGMKFQADLFDGLSKETQEEYLNSILDGILNPDEDKAKEPAKLIEEWLLQWSSGDIEGFKDSYAKTENKESDTEAEEFADMLFGERDKHMAEKIMEMLKSEKKATYFVVVGAGHFVVEDTIIDQLTENGYNVEIVK